MPRTFATTLALLLLLPTVALRAQAPETVFYMTNSEESFRSFRDHVDAISVVAPQVFSVEGDGVVWGRVDPRVLALAREHAVRVMPLIHNPGFDQAAIHRLLGDPEARARAVASMVALAVEHGFWGWQFDFENFHISDRDRMTAFYREAAEALRARGLVISIAVVPSLGRPGRTPFHRYMEANWRGAFDLGALAEIGDFISYMTYAQHGGVTPPGPIAGLPWMRATLDHALAQGVPPEKLSLGIPSYSGYWSPGYREADGARAVGAEIHWDRAAALLQRHGVQPRWLEDQGVYLAYWEDSGTFEWLFLENRRTFAAKLALLEEYPGLRGISVWVLGAEDPGIWGLLDSAR